MERARELSKPYLGKDGVIGLYVVGSATRPFRDELSDYDIEVVVTDETYAGLSDEERHVVVVDEGPPRRVDHEFYLRPWSEFERLIDSTQDLFHFTYQHAVILYDPEGRLAEVIGRLARLPDKIRQDRMKVHYLEFVFGVGRARKRLSRGSDLNLALLVAEGMCALVKVLFLQRRSWGATRHWTEQELRAIGIPDALLLQMGKTMRCPDEDALRTIVRDVNRWLAEQGETFHHDMNELNRWAFLRDEGKQAFQTWSAR